MPTVSIHMNAIQTEALGFYFHAKAIVEERGFHREAEWQKSLVFENLTESEFLRESAWVILCSGFNESIVRKHFSYISLCFHDWMSARAICEDRAVCESTALTAIRHAGKMSAICSISKSVDSEGFGNLKERIWNCPIDTLRRLPYIGEITVWHLAKNIGFPVAKPDRHMQRLSKTLGYGDVQHLCADLSMLTGEEIPVVDITLWRYLTFAQKQQ